MATLNQIPPKDPTAVLDYQFYWGAWLASGESITATNIVVPPGITLQSQPVVSGAMVTFWLAGGTAGVTYLIQCEIQTSQGRTDSRSFNLQVQTR